MALNRMLKQLRTRLQDQDLGIPVIRRLRLAGERMETTFDTWTLPIANRVCWIITWKPVDQLVRRWSIVGRVLAIPFGISAILLHNRLEGSLWFGILIGIATTGLVAVLLTGVLDLIDRKFPELHGKS